MSPLAFDKQGKPFSWHKRTAKLRVRLFRNPSARGTCCQVLDGVGAPLYVEADIDYSEFRRAVGGAPGFYRLDQCDEDGVEIEDAAPAYVSIEQLRNAGMVAEGGQAGDVSPLLIIERLVALHSDVMKTMASQHAAILASSAEVMRAPYRPAPYAPVAELRNADAANENQNADDDQDDDDELAETGAFAPMLSMLEPHLPRLGAFLYQKLVEFFRHAAVTPPAATSTSVPASAATVVATASHAAAGPVGVAAGYESTDLAYEAAVFEGEGIEVYDAPTVFVGTVAPRTAAASATTAPVEAIDEEPRNTQPAATPEQLAHLFAVRERLSPTEQALVERVIERMRPDLRAQYLGSLSAMSIEDATAFVRSLVAQARPARAAKPR